MCRLAAAAVVRLQKEWRSFCYLMVLKPCKLQAVCQAQLLQPCAYLPGQRKQPAQAKALR